MRACPESRRAIVGAVVGFAYGSVLAFLSFLAMAAGHGSWVPFLLSSAPFGVLVFFGDFSFYAALIGGAPVVWASFGALLAPSGRVKWRRLTQVLALLHYASGLALVAATNDDDVVGDGEPKTRAFSRGLSREERLEHLFFYVRRDAGAVVMNTDFHMIAKVSGRGRESRLVVVTIGLSSAPCRSIESVCN